ncbi:hypothetical protein [Yinghuangia aomiensis]
MSNHEGAIRHGVSGLSAIARPRALPLVPDRVWSDGQWARIRGGSPAKAMEDHWCAFSEGNTLFVYRSWSGHGIFEATFAPCPGGWRIVSAVVETSWRKRHPWVLSRHGAEYYCVLLEHLVWNVALAEPEPPTAERLARLRGLVATEKYVPGTNTYDRLRRGLSRRGRGR